MKIEESTIIPFTLTDDDRNVFSFATKMLKQLSKNMNNDNSEITCLDTKRNGKGSICYKKELLNAARILEDFSDWHLLDWKIENK